MAHNHGSIHGDDVYEQSLLAELEAAAPSAPAGASAALSPVVGEGVAEVLAQMNLDQNPPREVCLLYTSPSPRDQRGARMPSSA